MDWRLFASTFALIFLAELGDKTQLAALAASAGAKSPLSVFAGAASALVVATLIATLVGSTLQRFLPAHYLKGGAAILFFLFGALLLVSAVRTTHAAAEPAPVHVRPGMLASLVLNIARDFEDASSTDYTALAANQDSPILRSLFQHLAEEEQEHLQTLKRLTKHHGNSSWKGVETRTTPPPAAAPALDAPGRSAVTEALRHEQATEQFYRALAEASTTAPVRTAFAELAQAEASHVAHLERFLATGGFEEISG